MTQITVRDFVFDARVAGPASGEAIFLLHGYPQTGHAFRHELVALAKAGYRAIAPDQRGYSPGARPLGVENYTVALLLQDIIDLADALSIERFHLVGHDWGGLVGWAVAGQAEDRVLSYTAVSASHPDAGADKLADPASCQYAHSSYYDFLVTPDAFRPLIAADAALLRDVYADLPPEDAEIYVEALGNEAALQAALHWYGANIENRRFKTPALGVVQVPSRLVYGDADPYLCMDTAEASGAYAAEPYTFEVLPGVGHWIPDLAPDALSAAILRTIESAKQHR